MDRVLLPQLDYEALLALSEDLLSCGRETQAILDIVRRGARQLTEADGTTIILREGDAVHYVEEDAIGPLWKGQRFPAKACVSGWAIERARPAIIEDIYADPRVPIDAYRPTFVKSLAVVPFGVPEPIGALGTYWATRHAPSDREVHILRRLGNVLAKALHTAREEPHSSDALQVREEMLAAAAHELRNAMNAVVLRVATLRPVVGSSRVDLQACKLEYSIVSPK